MTSQPSQKTNKKLSPLVSICTPTFNRRPFIETMFQCFRNQTYPRSRMEWIIVDDGTDKIHDLVINSGITQIRYFQVTDKMTLGAKRNYMHSLTKGSILVYMDDDDYYPPERVAHAVEKLTQSPNALCAGSSELYIYFKHINQMFQCGPYGPNHSTAGTFAFKRELLNQTRYEDHAALAEEKAFLKNYTIPFVQLDPMKTILVFSHEHNTFDKRKLLENRHPQFFKESDKTVDQFIQRKSEKATKKFFMEDIDELLKVYEPGEPKMKPDVLIQIKQIEKDRQEMIKQHQQQQSQQIMMERPGQPPVAMSTAEVVNMIKQQQAQIGELSARIVELENISKAAQMQIMERNDKINKLQTELKPFREKEIRDRLKLLEKPDEIGEPVESNITKSTSQSWVVVEKSKTDPEIVINL